MKDKSPNLIIVMPDELRQQAVGLNKTDPVITPNLDAFAAESLTLTNALSNCPICSPARAMLLTGKYPISNGVTDNCYSKTTDFDVTLSADEVTFSNVLRDAGYSQGYIGKYHLDSPNERDSEYTEGWRGEPGKGGTLWDAYTPPGPLRHGFDFWYSYGCCDNHFTPHYWKNDAKIHERTNIEAWSVEHETNVAIEYIKNTDNEYRDGEKPFFLMVSHNPPHMPFKDVPQKYKDIYKKFSANELLTRSDAQLNKVAIGSVANYFSAISGIDEHFGRLLSALDAEGLDENTIVIFMSDHGEMMGSHDRMGKNSWYDEALLIPFLMRWKGKINPRSDDLLFGMPDITPSVLGLMGLSDRIPAGVEGRDYSKEFFGETRNRPTSGFYLTAQPIFSEERRGIKTLTHTFVMVLDKPSGKVSHLLFDNVADPQQLTNIADNQVGLIKDFKSQLADWLLKTNDNWLLDTEHFEDINIQSSRQSPSFFSNLCSIISQK